MIYTDGSKKEDHVAYAVVTEKTKILKKLSPFASVFTSEITAILESLNYINEQIKNQFIIFSNSKSALQAINSERWKSPLVQRILEKTTTLKNQNKDIIMCWIPGHCNIPGNIEADKKAKEAAKLPYPHNSTVTYHDYRSEIRKYFQNQDTLNWQSIQTKLLKFRTSRWEINHVSFLTRKEQSKLSRIRIGHTNLTHIHLITKT